MPRDRPIGSITRGTTHPNRLRRCDRWLLATHRRVLGEGGPPLVVDLGYGATGGTTLEWFERLRQVRPDVEVLGLEIDPARVEAARPLRRPGLDFAVGGFEVPAPRRARVIRAINVLRQYDEEEVGSAWGLMCDRLEDGGLLVEGTCDELGRLGAWVALDQDGPRTLTLSWRLGDLGPQRPPSVVAERLPKALIHRNVSGEAVHAVLQTIDEEWARAAPFAPYGPRQRMEATVRGVRERYDVLGDARRWRLGEVTLPWSVVAPAQRE